MTTINIVYSFQPKLDLYMFEKEINSPSTNNESLQMDTKSFKSFAKQMLISIFFFNFREWWCPFTHQPHFWSLNLEQLFYSRQIIKYKTSTCIQQPLLVRQP
jgi:hypothetical protein